MLTLLLLLGAVLYLISRLETADHTDLRGEPGPAHAACLPAGGALGAVQRLSIADTIRPLLESVQFIRAFGLEPNAVRDVCVYAREGGLDTLPAHLSALLLELHREGSVVGAETMALLFHGRALAGHEAVYFTLTAGAPMPRVVAFIGARP